MSFSLVRISRLTSAGNTRSSGLLIFISPLVLELSLPAFELYFFETFQKQFLFGELERCCRVWQSAARAPLPNSKLLMGPKYARTSTPTAPRTFDDGRRFSPIDSSHLLACLRFPASLPNGNVGIFQSSVFNWSSFERCSFNTFGHSSRYAEISIDNRRLRDLSPRDPRFDTKRSFGQVIVVQDLRVKEMGHHGRLPTAQTVEHAGACVVDIFYDVACVGRFENDELCHRGTLPRPRAHSSNASALHEKSRLHGKSASCTVLVRFLSEAWKHRLSAFKK